MKNLLGLSVMFCVAILLWGCPYKSAIPLGEANQRIDKQLFGKWIPETQLKKENPEYYLIEMKDTLHYDVSHFQFNEEEKAYIPKQYLCWPTQLENITFMNVKESGQSEIMMHRLNMLGDSLMVLFQVTDNIDEKFTDQEKMRSFFEKHMRLSFFYNNDEVKLVKTKK